jgi:hypothetical protein
VSQYGSSTGTVATSRQWIAFDPSTAIVAPASHFHDSGCDAIAEDLAFGLMAGCNRP